MNAQTEITLPPFSVRNAFRDSRASDHQDAIRKAMLHSVGRTDDPLREASEPEAVFVNQRQIRILRSLVLSGNGKTSQLRHRICAQGDITSDFTRLRRFALIQNVAESVGHEAVWTITSKGRALLDGLPKGEHDGLVAPPANGMRRTRAETLAAHQACSSAGLTASEAARLIGVTYAAVTEYARHHGIKYRDWREAEQARKAVQQ